MNYAVIPMSAIREAGRGWDARFWVSVGPRVEACGSIDAAIAEVEAEAKACMAAAKALRVRAAALQKQAREIEARAPYTGKDPRR